MKFFEKTFILTSLFGVILGNVHVPIEQDLFQFVSLDRLLKMDSSIAYQQCHEATPFDYGQFPFCMWPEQQPCHGMYAPTFVLSIPNGQVCSHDGHVVVDGKYIIHELVPKSYKFHHYVNLVLWNSFGHARKVPGKVAVITKQHYACYGHWLSEILGRLAILEIMGVEYDWLYVSTTYEHQTFMKETLKLWGIDSDKIIEPTGEFYHIQADELIVPSFSNRRMAQKGEHFYPDALLCAAYYPQFVIEFLRAKFLPMVQKSPNKNWAKKVYISREDANNGRKIINEDEVFNALSQYGFKKYVLSQMSFLEQVALFSQAEYIVATHGSGLANVMFCNKDAHVVEMFQARSDCGFYTIAKTVGVKYTPIKTVEFDFFGHYDTHVPLSCIEDIVTNVFKLEPITKTLPYPYNQVDQILPFDNHGWYANAVRIEQLIKKHNVQTVIEVGSWLGLSTRHIASLIPEHGVVYAVDTWEGSAETNTTYAHMLPHLYQQFLSNIIHAGLTSKIKPIKATSLRAADVLYTLQPQCDLVYIDAAHDTDSVQKDFEVYFPFVNNHRGVLCGDDWMWDSVKAAVISCAQKYNLTVHAQDNFWFVEESGYFDVRPIHV